jgi:hypothetical protein
LDFSPEQGEETGFPVTFDFTVVDAVTTVRSGSVGLEVSFEVEAEPVDTPSPSETPSFRIVSKRIPIELSPCDDATSTPCASSDLGLSGFRATGRSMELPEGPIEARIVAENQGDPTQALDFRYPFAIVVTPTPGSGS